MQNEFIISRISIANLFCRNKFHHKIQGCLEVADITFHTARAGEFQSKTHHSVEKNLILHPMVPDPKFDRGIEISEIELQRQLLRRCSKQRFFLFNRDPIKQNLHRRANLLDLLMVVKLKKRPETGQDYGFPAAGAAGSPTRLRAAAKTRQPFQVAGSRIWNV
ncbi:MAG: hypothetical protein ABIJ61_11565 [bacterium]